jgi:hypothetical protein
MELAPFPSFAFLHLLQRAAPLAVGVTACRGPEARTTRPERTVALSWDNAGEEYLRHRSASIGKPSAQ